MDAADSDSRLCATGDDDRQLLGRSREQTPMEYNAMITIEITQDRRAGRVHVIRIGVGL